MHWNPEPLTYDICVPPRFTDGPKDLWDFSREETRKYFSWFLSVIPQRIDYLSKTCAAALNVKKSVLDRSADSLLPLWRWFLQTARTEPIQNPPNHRSTKQLTLQTEYILRDIGMYLGEVFLANHKSLHWGYYEKPKTDMFVNHPVILWFEDRSFDPPFRTAFEPIHMAGVQAAKIMQERAAADDLWKVYRWWEKYCIDS